LSYSPSEEENEARFRRAVEFERESEFRRVAGRLDITPEFSPTARVAKMVANGRNFAARPPSLPSMVCPVGLPRTVPLAAVGWKFRHQQIADEQADVLKRDSQLAFDEFVFELRF